MAENIETRTSRSHGWAGHKSVQLRGTNIVQNSNNLSVAQACSASDHMKKARALFRWAGVAEPDCRLAIQQQAASHLAIARAMEGAHV